MAGHSHAANIRHRKAAVDAKRGAAFSRHAKLITTAARIGGGDPKMNARLALAIEKARADNMPKDSIERAVKKGTGELGGTRPEEVRYEGYGPGGVAVIVDCVTDNRNRTAPELRQILERNGGALAEAGAVAWNFDTRALCVVPAEGVDEDHLTEVVLELGGDDIVRDGAVFEVTAEPTAVARLRDGLEAAGFKLEKAELSLVPRSTVTVGKQDAERLLELFDALEEHDDVQSLASNVDIPEAVLAQLGG